MAESIEESILLCSLLYYNEHRNIREEIRTMKRMWKIITAAGLSVLQKNWREWIRYGSLMQMRQKK